MNMHSHEIGKFKAKSAPLPNWMPVPRGRHKLVLVVDYDGSTHTYLTPISAGMVCEIIRVRNAVVSCPFVAAFVPGSALMVVAAEDRAAAIMQVGKMNREGCSAIVFFRQRAIVTWAIFDFREFL